MHLVLQDKFFKIHLYTIQLTNMEQALLQISCLICFAVTGPNGGLLAWADGDTHPYILDAFSRVEAFKQQMCQGQQNDSGSASK